MTPTFMPKDTNARVGVKLIRKMALLCQRGHTEEAENPESPIQGTHNIRLAKPQNQNQENEKLLKFLTIQDLDAVHIQPPGTE